MTPQQIILPHFFNSSDPHTYLEPSSQDISIISPFFFSEPPKFTSKKFSCQNPPFELTLLPGDSHHPIFSSFLIQNKTKFNNLTRQKNLSISKKKTKGLKSIKK